MEHLNIKRSSNFPAITSVSQRIFLPQQWVGELSHMDYLSAHIFALFVIFCVSRIVIVQLGNWEQKQISHFPRWKMIFSLCAQAQVGKYALKHKMQLWHLFYGPQISNWFPPSNQSEQLAMHATDSSLLPWGSYKCSPNGTWMGKTLVFSESACRFWALLKATKR